MAQWQASRQEHEGWLEWLLYRKLSTTSKVLLGIGLTILWLKYAFNLVAMVRFFEVSLAMAILLGIVWGIKRGYYLLKKVSKKRS